jgi:NAD(P)-dependent dehydrogenase (short-subunit alcohol dehydrogenase family)
VLDFAHMHATSDGAFTSVEPFAAALAAADAVLAKWGRVDVLVNNGRFVGPGHNDRFEDTPLELLDLHLEANVMAPLAFIKRVLPGMIERRAGVVVNITSGVAWHDPPAPADEGGWGLAYAMSKGALQRIAGILAVEVGDRGIRAYNVQPGAIATERRSDGAPPEIVAAVVVWLVTDPAAAEPNGRNVEAQDVCRDLHLVAGWEG